MFELLEIAKSGDLHGRGYPIVLADADLSAVGRVRYIAYWEHQKRDLDAGIKEIGAEHLEGIREELDLYADIRGMLGRITEVLADMNALTPEQHRGSNFDELIRKLQAKASE